MPNYYKPSGGSASSSGYKPEKVGGGAGGTNQLNIDKPAKPAAGKLNIDLTDPAGSLADTAGSIADFGGGLVGGIAGGIGGIGFGDGANLGALGDVPGNVLGAVGSVPLPSTDPNIKPTLGDVPGTALAALGLPQRALERTVAGQRVEAAQRGQTLDIGAALGAGPLGPLTNLARLNPSDADAKLPPDLQERLDAGESVDAIADELVARGAGYSSNPGTNLTSQVLFDPLNLLSGGGAAAGRAAARAGTAVRSADDLAKLGLGPRLAGVAYNAASRGLSAGGARLMDGLLGPSTSGVLHALGTKPYQSITGGLGKLDRSYRQAFEDAFARGAAQMPRAVIAHYMADEASALVRRFGDDAMSRLPGDIEATITNRLQTVRRLAPDDIERRSQELLYRVAPTFDGMAPEALTAATARKLSAITGASVEDATRMLGTVDRQTAQTVHLAFYGRAGDDLARAKATTGMSDAIDVQRLTIVSDDTLTAERAAEVLANPAGLDAAVERYGILANRFSGKQYDHAQVREFIERLRDQDALITTVTRPTTGKSPLPKALSEWRTRYLDNGYDLGFAPESGWKVVTDADGVPVYADPFAHFVSDADPIQFRNPLGRFADSLFRETTQTTIVGESRQRLVDAVADRGLPVSPNQTRAIHKAILEEAADRGVTPRSLVADTNVVRSADGTAERVGVIDAIWRRFLTADEYKALTAEVDPVFLTLSAFQGNLRTVGLSQYLTGGAKRLPGLGPMAAHVAERIYPNVRFALNPLFQLQELIESRFFNAMRGIVHRPLDPEVAKVYGELAQLPELRYLTEAGYFLNLANGQGVARFMGANTPVGRALGRFANVQGQKSGQRIAQVLSEHGDEFRDAVDNVNPRAWKAMEEAYGTTDPRTIADRYLAERFAIGPDEDVAAALARFDASRALGKTAADETVWQAFRTTFEQASRQAFRTHYFRPQRGWLERTLNHPYLGIYPLSYMYGKVLPEFARFLLRRPFGLDAPLVGYAGLVKVQQATIAAIADDAEFRAYLEDHPDALFLLHSLIPGDPTQLGAGLPAWSRHISADLAAGKPVTADTLSREAMDTVGYAFGAVRGPATIAEGLADVAGDLFANLDRAAAEYDGQFSGLTLGGSQAAEQPSAPPDISTWPEWAVAYARERYPEAYAALGPTLADAAGAQHDQYVESMDPDLREFIGEYGGTMDAAAVPNRIDGLGPSGFDMSKYLEGLRR